MTMDPFRKKLNSQFGASYYATNKNFTPDSLHKMPNPECIICAETYTSKSEACCVYCQYKTCRKCVRQFCLNETEPKCMNCKKPWTREHQNTILKPTFVNKELKKHMEQIMFDRERAQFPATILVIEDRREVEKFNLELNMLRREYEAMCATFNYMSEKKRQLELMIDRKVCSPKYFPEKTREQLNAELKTTESEIGQIRGHMIKINSRSRNLTQWIRMPYDRRRIAIENHIEGANPEDIAHTMTLANPASTTRDKRKFVRACPIESCRGFLSSQWKCGICGIHTCSKCHVPKNDQKNDTSDPNADAKDHICNPDDVATAELLDQDTRPCPQCGQGIFKIDGCDQMWCIECHCAFSWTTGNIESGHVHNPHYFEYQRRTGNAQRNVMDLPCNALEPAAYHGVVYELITRVINHKSHSLRHEMKLPPITREGCNQIRTKAIDCAISIETISRLMVNYRPDAIQSNLESRIKYLTEEINEQEFKSYLSRDTKKFNKNREIGQVLQTVVFAMTDILNRLIELLRTTDIPRTERNYATEESIMPILSEVDSLMNYANECLQKICVEYKITRVGLFIRNQELKQSAGLCSVNVFKTEGGGERIEPKGYR